MEESAESWRQLTGRDDLEHFSRHRQEMEARLAEFAGPKLIVPFHELIEDQEAWVTKLSDFIGLPLNHPALTVVDPSWRHFGGGD
jgi:hypothetical protein